METRATKSGKNLKRKPESQQQQPASTGPSTSKGGRRGRAAQDSDQQHNSPHAGSTRHKRARTGAPGAAPPSASPASNPTLEEAKSGPNTRSRSHSRRGKAAEAGAKATSKDPQQGAPALAAAAPAVPPPGPVSEPEAATQAEPSQQPQDKAAGDGGGKRSYRKSPTQRDMANRQGRLGEEDKDAGDVFGRNLSNASSALHGLLRRLGAGFEDMMPLGGVSGSRIKGILQGLKQVDDEGAQLSALSELNELLSISTEDMLTSFPVESAVPVLVQLLNAEHNPDIMLMAARALTFMADVLPPSCGTIVRHGAVPAFCARLLTIEYIDLAEQSLQALEKLSHEYSSALLQSGGLLAVLSYLDFFPSSVQRTACATAANMCRSLLASPSSAASSSVQSAVKEAIPMLANLLQYQDAKVVDHACVALSYIAEAAAGQPALLEALNSPGNGLLQQALQLIGLNESGGMASPLSVSTYYGLIKLLATCAASSAEVAKGLMAGGVLDVVRTLLVSSPLLAMSAAGRQAAAAGGAPAPVLGGGASALLKTADQAYEVVGLASELLPPLPDVTAQVLAGAPLALTVMQEASGAVGGRRAELAAYLASSPVLTKRLVTELLPLVLQLYGATVLPQVRMRCLVLLLQLLAHCPASQLREGLVDIPLAAFLAGLLACRDGPQQAAALVCCEVIMQQLPDVFRPVLVKEGVLYAVESMAAAGSGTQQQGAAPAPAAVAAPPPPAAASPPPAAQAQLAETARRVTRSASAAHKDDKAAPSGKGDAAGGAADGAAKGSLPPSGGSAPAAPSFGGAPQAVPDAAPAGGSGTLAGRSTQQRLREALAARAARFKAQYYDSTTGGAVALETDGLVKVRGLLANLHNEPSGTVTQLLALLGQASSSTDNVSVFELLNSGAAKALRCYLSGEDLPRAAAGDEAKADARATAVLRRVADFMMVALPPSSGPSPPLLPLVRKLQAALDTTENLPVLYSGGAAPSRGGAAGGGLGLRGSMGMGSGGLSRGGSMASNGGSLSSGLAALAHPFKLRLCRHGNERHLRDYASNIVLIEPLATMSAIEDFLWPRVARPGAPADNAPAAAGATAGTAAGSGGSMPAARAASAAVPMPSAAQDGKVEPVPVAINRTGSAPAAAGAAGAAAHGRSGSVPVPEEAANRRVTRAQAARAQADADAARQRNGVPMPTRGNRAGAGGSAHGDAVAGAAAADAEMAVAGDGERRPGSGGSDDEGDAEMADAPDGGDDDAMFDEDDEDFDEEAMDGDEGEMDIGNMHVHDLEVDDQPQAAAQPAAAAAGTASGQQQQRRGAAAAAPPAPAPGAQAAAAHAAGAAGGSAAGSSARAGAPPNAWTRSGQPGAAGGRAAANGRPPAHMTQQQRLTFSIERAAAGGASVDGAAVGTAPSGDALSPSTTVFQAILQQQLAGAGASVDDGDEDGNGGNGLQRGRRLWDDVHTLHYRSADASAAATDDEGAGSSAAGAPVLLRPAATLAVAGRWAQTPLGELLAAGTLPDLPNCGEQCREVLALLSLLEAVVRLGPRACAEVPAAAADDSDGKPAMQAKDAPGAAACSSGGAPASGSAPPGLLRCGWVAREEFVSSKLSSKLGAQLKDVLAICGGGLPPWCRTLALGGCRFLFPFEARKRYFYLTTFGLGRALAYMQAMHTAEAGGAPAAGDRDGMRGDGLRVGRVQRQKVRVSRKRILESAHKVMELYARSRAMLELEYFGEVGTGLGPTLEFYTLLSHELQRRDLGMWRHEQAEEAAAGSEGAGGSSAAAAEAMEVDGGAGAAPQAAPAPAAAARGSAGPRHQEPWHEAGEFVNAPWGLFPRPLPAGARSGHGAGGKVVEAFRLLGRTMAKALQDSRLLDLPLSHVFYAAALGVPLDLWDVGRFDPQLGANLVKLQAALDAAHAEARASGQPLAVKVDGCPVEDLCLTFVLPGYPDYPLVPNGGDVVVDSASLGAYIAGVVDATLGSGIAAQLAAFREGFNEVFDVSALGLFYEDELEVLVCGAGEAWTVQGLVESIKFDHGYNAQSPPVRYLLEVLSELDGADQRRFLRFVTGCPRLPPGGLAALQPRLTVVRKHPSGGDGPSAGITPVGSFKEPAASIGGAGAGAAVCAADGDLPSVMTCANYIKLPPYSSKAVMADRLMYAIREGQGSFDLS